MSSMIGTVPHSSAVFAQGDSATPKGVDPASRAKRRGNAVSISVLFPRGDMFRGHHTELLHRQSGNTNEDAPSESVSGGGRSGRMAFTLSK